VADAMKHEPKRSLKIKLGKIEVNAGSDPPMPVLQNVSKQKNAHWDNC